MRCAFYEKEITPPIGDDIPGYFEPRFTEGVEDRLYVKAVVFAEDEAGSEKMTALVSLDAVHVEETFCRKVKERASSYTGIPAERLAVCANHTHYGIPSGGSYHIYGERDEAYMDVLERVTADCITLAFRNLRSCRLSYGIGREDTVAYHRDYVMRDGRIITNPYGQRTEIVRPYGEIDPDLPVLSVWDQEGVLMGTLFTYALHQDTVGKSRFSGDFSSEIARQLKKRFGEQSVSVFLAGCCGDINHVDHMGGVQRKTRQIGQTLAKEVIRVIEEDSSPVAEGAVDAEYETAIVLRRHASQEEVEHARLAVADPGTYLRPDESVRHMQGLLQYEAEHTGQDEEMYLPVQILKISDVWFFILPGEMYSAFGQRIKREFPGEKWLISELANCGLGYVATEELYGTNIYPGKLMGTACIEPSGGNKLVDAILNLARKMAGV